MKDPYFEVSSTTQKKVTNEWDSVIEPRFSLFKLNLRELWGYRDLFFLLVKRDFVTFYKQTILGPLWFFIQPLFTTLIYVFVFGGLAGWSTDGLPQPLFYMTGIIAWNYFAECLNKTSTVFKDNAYIFSKVYFPRLVMPFSIVGSNLVRFAVQVILLGIAILYFAAYNNYDFTISKYFLLFPFLVLLMALLGLGLGLIVSSMTIKYRDLSYVVTFGVQLLMFATPIIYPFSGAPEKLKSIIALNPMTPIIEGIRLSVLGKGELSFSSVLYATSFTLIVLIFGIIIFNKVERSFTDRV